MLIAIHRTTDVSDAYVEGWASCLAARGVDVRWVDLTERDIFQQIEGCNGVMWHWSRSSNDQKLYRILKVIEFNLGIPVFPNHHSSWHRRDKLAQYYLLQSAGIPMPKTWIFWEKQAAREWALTTNYPKVFKLSSSGGRKDVVLVSSPEEACLLIDRMFGPGIYRGQIGHKPTCDKVRNWWQPRTLARFCKDAILYVVRQRPPSRRRLEQGYVYFQEFIPGNAFKTDIAVIGDLAFGSRSFNGPGDFRNSLDRIDYDPLHIDLNCVQRAIEISRRLGFHMMGFDILLHQGTPVILEMSFRNETTRGYWKRNLEWVSEPISPQKAQVEVFLNEIGLGNGKEETTPDWSHVDRNGPKTALSPSLSQVNEEAKARDH